MQPDQPWHALEPGEVYEALGSSESGLTSLEAAARLEKFGPNELKRQKGRSLVSIFLGQFKNVLIYVLLAAMAISFFIGEEVDAAIIGAIVLLNALLGTYQEHQAEMSLESLQQYLVSETFAVRDRRRTKIRSAELVPGDVVELEAGDSVPADARIIYASHLRVDESALTGESVPSEKGAGKVDVMAPVGDMENMLFAGTVLTDGRSRAIVVSTGMRTEIGRIASLVETSVERETPMQISLDRLGKFFGAAALLASVAIFAIGELQGREVFEMFLTSVSLAVAAIPEGLPATVTIILALGVQRMARRKAIVRKLSAVETLGSTNVICSDKTGTLTQNAIVVRRIVTPARTFEVTGEGYAPEGEVLAGGRKVAARDDPGLLRLLDAGVLCNNATYERRGDRMVQMGDSTEVALLVLGARAGLYRVLREDDCPRKFEIPFSSETRFMLTVNDCDPENYAYAKGAPEVILGRCTSVLAGGSPEPLTPDLRERFLKENEQMAAGGMRVLGFAYKHVRDPIQQNIAGIETGLTFLGLAGMIDPPRPEVKASIEQCHRSGINVVMITGDQLLTATSIARELGIAGPEDEAVTGAELNAMSDEEIDRHVRRIRVYARTSPEQKLRIVRSLQRQGSIVAMTGDGVNDAPALKTADIGVSMGLGGTDVARQASDMVLSDDNFATIVSAIQEGRSIYENVRKTVKFLFSSNFGEVLAVFLGILLGLPLTLLAIQILWVNLITDSLPALALGVDRPDPRVMGRRPRQQGEGIINRAMAIDIAVIGTIIGLGTFGYFYVALPSGEEYARTMAFTALVAFQMWNVINCKAGNRSVLSRETFNNVYLWIAIAVSLALTAVIIYVPYLQGMFRTVSLGLHDWLLLFGGTIVLIVAAELRKALFRVEA